MDVSRSLLTIANLSAFGHFVLYTGESWRPSGILSCGFFDRSKTKVKAIQANFWNGATMQYQRVNFPSRATSWHGVFSSQVIDKDRFHYCLMVNQAVNDTFLLCPKELSERRKWIYHYLMLHTKLPLLEEWTPYIMEKTSLFSEISLSFRGEDVLFPFAGKEYHLSELCCYDFRQFSEDSLKEVVSYGLRKGKIRLCDTPQKPLELKCFDDYIQHYGKSIVEKLEQEIKPLTKLEGKVNVALNTKRLFPQQGACVNGIKALFKKGERLGIMNEGMGVGKTLQAASVIDAYFVDEYLSKHPDATLADAYAEDGVINYRAIIMPPGHLVEKWATELQDEIPYAKPVILNDLSQLMELKCRGKKPCGKEFYIIGKDFAKLGTQLSPLPTLCKTSMISAATCKDCLDEGRISHKIGYGKKGECGVCHGKNFVAIRQPHLGKYKGMLCPHCGELLLKNGSSLFSHMDEDDFDISKHVLTPASFSSKNNGNATCYHCGKPLWGANVRPSAPLKNPSKWYKVSHYSNHTHKTTTSAFVLSGHEQDYYDTVITTAGLKKSAAEYGPRKYSPALYIRKYLKGFFDFAVLDECHKYAGAGTAQANAAQALGKASRFVLGLTGTISNGTASSFYYLYWMLNPRKIRSLGYNFSAESHLKFCYRYGCVEKEYEADGDISSVRHNGCSRGRQLGSPKVKPGISPVLFAELLLDNCVYLDISDLSKYLPSLTEEIRTVAMPSDIGWAYHSLTDSLKGAIKEEGLAAASNMLQCGLSYPDKPYGRRPIYSPNSKDTIIATIPNFDVYRDKLLPKEEELVRIVKQELSENRNCFIFATFTGNEEVSVTERLKEVVEKHCNLLGRVEIIKSTSPAAAKREQWMHKRASEGIRVFITNPKNVETGLDFCFKHNGVSYNYPTLIFYQVSYELAVMWQASRRAYRLNQTEDCRNFYIAYEDTLQMAALEIMANKQVATAAIQGKFSADGLSSMAKGVDARAQLAAAMSANDFSSRESLENMFDVLNATRANEEEDLAYAGYEPPKTFYELVGHVHSVSLNTLSHTDDWDFTYETDLSEISITSSLSADAVEDVGTGDDIIFSFEDTYIPQSVTSAPKRKKKVADNQFSLFDLL